MHDLRYLYCALLGYFLGSINTAIILSRMRGGDIRSVGSGNAGATNILRTYGKAAALIVVLFDILKGVLAAILGRLILGEYGGYLAGFCAILGHNFPLYFGFRGGKGIITSLAVMTVFAPMEALTALVVGIIIIAVTRYVSLGSVLGVLVFAILAIIRVGDLWFRVFAVVTAVLAIARHHSNIIRILRGTERKLGK